MLVSIAVEAGIRFSELSFLAWRLHHPVFDEQIVYSLTQQDRTQDARLLRKLNQQFKLFRVEIQRFARAFGLAH
jgi:hypothetical protein